MLPLEQQIVVSLNLKTGRLIDEEKVLTKLTKIYKDYHVNKKPEISDLSKWYAIKDVEFDEFGNKIDGKTVICCHIRKPDFNKYKFNKHKKIVR